MEWVARALALAMPRGDTLGKRLHSCPPVPPGPAHPAADVTKVAERTISDDLEFLISQAVDTSKADYAGEGWTAVPRVAEVDLPGAPASSARPCRFRTTSPLPPCPAVITGVQIHNWANDFEDDSPNLEFVAPTAAYVVVSGVKTHVELNAVPPLTPRQTRLLNGTPDLSAAQGGSGVVMEESPDSTYDSKEARRAQRLRLQK